MNKYTHSDAVLAVYKSHEEAEACVRDLQRSGFDMKKLSIIGRDYHTDEHVIGYYNTGDRVKYWGTQGAFWGGIWGFPGMFLSTPLTVTAMVILAQFPSSHWVAVLLSGDGDPFGGEAIEARQEAEAAAETPAPPSIAAAQ